ncbi:CHAP domain-containing protein [Nonomuraea indica]|uniref:CHAP domain-containing protein n=1 Tax=Nonomuraea indica TaxID=1581193 RepID=UPI000C7E61AC|nr:CHAP domain-containing protein [Nonomuraea indica]
MTSRRDRFLAIARRELGTRERADGTSKYGSWYARTKPAPGFAAGAWCQMFTAWCAHAAGIPEAAFPRMAYTPYAVRWFKDNGRWGTRPKVGALVYFNFPGGGDAVDHVEIVEAIRADGSIVTIGGNVSNQVKRLVRRSNIAGYGYPDYSEPAPPKPSKPKPDPDPMEAIVRKLPHLKLGDGKRDDDHLKWDVKTLHKLLEARDCANLDGVDDTEYTQAHADGVRAIQQDAGLPQTGRPDLTTWAALLRVL